MILETSVYQLGSWLLNIVSIMQDIEQLNKPSIKEPHFEKI